MAASRKQFASTSASSTAYLAYEDIFYPQYLSEEEKLEVVRGTGNVFRDVGHKNADAEQFKAILAAEIMKAIDRERLTMRAAHKRIGTTRVPHFTDHELCSATAPIQSTGND